MEREFFNKQRLLTPGPTQLPDFVRLALAQDMLHHRKQAFKKIMESVQQKLQILFGTKFPVLPLSCSGTGAMTAAVYSLFAPGEKALVVEAGKFGQRWREIARSRNLEVISLEVEWGKAVTPDKIEEALNNHPDISGVLLQMCETSTGAMMPVKEIAEITSSNKALLVVDGISAVGISPCPMDDWKIDCLLTGSQKGLMLPPGLALIALSERSWQKAENTAPGCYYFNLPAEKKIIATNETHFTTPVNLIMGLEASLNFLLKDGLDNIYKKQWALTMLVREGAKALNLEPFAHSAFAWGVTALKMPDGINASEIIDIAHKEFGVIMAGGQDYLKGKIVRIGHMGWVDWSDCMAGLHSIAFAIQKITEKPVNQDYAGIALKAYYDSLANWPQITHL